MNKKAEQIKALFADKDFVIAALDAENETAVQELFSDNGVEISTDEIDQIRNLMMAVAEGKVTEEQIRSLSENEGELSEEALEQVAGGDWKAAVAAIGILAIPITGLTIGILEYNGIPACQKIQDAKNWCIDKLTRW
ncbi:MAG: hypothetical protein IKN55_03765 [Oscillospiraceae bacterium]|nr:hypothetical protein [Oscillospiraceae bacterium]